MSELKRSNISYHFDSQGLCKGPAPPHGGALSSSWLFSHCRKDLRESTHWDSKFPYKEQVQDRLFQSNGEKKNFLSLFSFRQFLSASQLDDSS